MAGEWSKGLIEIDALASEKFGEKIDIWQLGQLPELLAPSCWGVIAARLLLSEPFEDAVPGFLQYIGLAAGVDRAWLLRFNEGMTLLRNTHEWCAPDVPSHVTDLQNVPVTILGEMLLPLRKGKSVAINDVDQMPRSLRPMKAEFHRQGIKSTLTVPVVGEQGLVGCIGLDSAKAVRRWTDDEVHALMQIAALMAVARTEGAPRSRPPDDEFSVPVYLRTGGAVRGVPLPDIAAIHADGDGSFVHLRDGKTLPDDRSLKWWQAVLPGQDFLRVHRSGIANMRRVETMRRRIGGQDLELHMEGNGGPLRISRNKSSEVRRRLGI